MRIIVCTLDAFGMKEPKILKALRGNSDLMSKLDIKFDENGKAKSGYENIYLTTEEFFIAHRVVKIEQVIEATDKDMESIKVVS